MPGTNSRMNVITNRRSARVARTMGAMRLPLLMVVVAFAASMLISCTAGGRGGECGSSCSACPNAKATAKVREFHPYLNKKWIGNGISYGPYRDGQSPMGAQPTDAELHADLQLLCQHWHMLRMYGSRGAAERVVRIIHEDKLPMRVMVGAWIAQEVRKNEQGEVVEHFPDAVAANKGEIATAIRLANQYPDVVMAVSVGNETQVEWSSHRVQPDTLINYIRQVRDATNVPVTCADDFLYWTKPESKRVADECDFIVTHAYAMWWGRTIDQAIPFTKEKYAAVKAMHPEHTIVLGESGWATQRHTEGDQAKLMAGVAGESEQATYYHDYVAWTTKEHIPNFYFEAFDETWKGGAHPDEVEKHWGLYRVDRTPKLALEQAR